MDTVKIEKKDSLLLFLLFFVSFLIAVGIFDSGISKTISGFLKLQVHPARLINDFIEIAGIGSALFNAAMVGIIGIILIKLAGIQFSGPTFAAILTMAGFGLFGKTPLNILPIVLGVYISAKVVNKTFKDYLIIALFGTALGPLVSTIAWEIGMPLIPAILTAVAGGIVTGFLLPPIAFSMLHLHQGYNLYNMGLTCGFFGLFTSALIRGLGHSYSATIYWYDGPSLILKMIIPVLSILLIIVGLARGGRKSLKNFLEVLTIPGRLPSDFVDLASLSGTFINSGLIGIFGSLYIFIIDAPFNGPVIGGLLTIMGFGAFGTHVKNSWPVVAGVIIATFASGNSLKAPGPVLAAIFSTTLSPLAGEFGIFAGFIAGVIHLFMVMQTGAWSGGMNLYNNGFAGGLTAALIISVIQWYRTNKEEF
ncbi:MAG: DUF1576 domain-containing protein [Spirochaetaceae bacterium]|nr:DUF1576 domain-containing protein [Spirochaetaceae bacterium]